MNPTVADWRPPNYHMVWSIYDKYDWETHTQKDFQYESEEDDSYSRIRLDLTAPAGLPNGSYTAVVYLKEKGTCSGVLVRNNLFMPEETDRAVFNAMLRAEGKDPEATDPKVPEWDHIFIEAVRWNETEQAIEFSLGS